MILRLFRRFEAKARSEQARIMALLGYNFNSTNKQAYKAVSLLDNREYDLQLYNQFVASHKVYSVEKIEVGHWKIPLSRIRDRFSDIQFYQNYRNAKTDFLDFYFPLDLLDQYEGLTASLGPADEIATGIMTASGRTIWVFHEGRMPFALKIDTSQLNERKYFSERLLTDRALLRSVQISQMLANDPHLFSENQGYSFIFGAIASDRTNKRITCLIRSLDYEMLKVEKSDLLMPVLSLLSREFWSNEDLIASLGLSRAEQSGLLDDLAECLAQLIKSSLLSSHFHHEIHQQNLTLVVRNGKGVKILCHDLEDSLFDPAGYMLANTVKEVSRACFEKLYLDVFEIVRMMQKNPLGQVVFYPAMLEVRKTIVSYYVQYIRSFGNYLKAYNSFKGLDYLEDRTFETKILKGLKLTEAELDLAVLANERDLPALRNNLYWVIDRFHTVKQQNEVNALWSKVHGADKFATVPMAELRSILTISQVSATKGLPVCFGDINFDDFDLAYDLAFKKVLLVRYRGQPMLVFAYQGIRC